MARCASTTHTPIFSCSTLFCSQILPSQTLTTVVILARSDTDFILTLWRNTFPFGDSDWPRTPSRHIHWMQRLGVHHEDNGSSPRYLMRKLQTRDRVWLFYTQRTGVGGSCLITAICQYIHPDLCTVNNPNACCKTSIYRHDLHEASL